MGLVRKGNLPGGGFQYKSGARESFVETALPVGPAAFGQPLDSRTLARSEALRASPGLRGEHSVSIETRKDVNEAAQLMKVGLPGEPES